MAADNKLELVVVVDVDKANASIKSVNQGLSSMEQAAVRAGTGASRGIDGMTVSMVKGATAGNLLADSIKKALEFAKSWTIEAAKYASETERMDAVTRGLAKAHGESVADTMRYVEAVKAIGFTTQEAEAAIQKMIIADLDLSKAAGLAKIAKDAAAVSTEGLSAGEAFEKMMLAIESGAARGLRSMAMFPDFQKEITIRQLQLNRTLTEAEEKEIRYNAVVREGAKLHGAHAEALQTADGQMKVLAREVTELREQIGSQFQSELKGVIGMFRDLVGWLRDNTSWLAKLGEGAVVFAGILATYAVATKIDAVTASLRAMATAAAANPWALLATGVVAGGAIIAKTWHDTQKGWEERAGEMRQQQIRGALAGGSRLERLRNQGYADDEIRKALLGERALPGQGYDVGTGFKITRGGPDLDALKLAAEVRKKQAEAERQSLEGALQAEAQFAVGPRKTILEMQREATKLSTFVDERGIERTFQLTSQTRENLERELAAKVQVIQRESVNESLKRYREEYEARLAWESKLMQARIQADEETARKDLEYLQQVYAFEEDRAGFVRDAQLRAVEATDAQTLQQKLAVEQKKADIEIEYLEKVEQIKLRLFDMDTSRMALEEESRLRQAGKQADEIYQRIGDLTQQREDIRRQISESTDAAIDAARENSANRQTQMIRDQQRSIFDSLKQQAGGVFDAMLQKSQSVWSAMGNSLKTAILTAIKDVVTSRIAQMFMQLLGMPVQLAPGQGVGGGTGIGRMLGALGIGAVPVFGASSLLGGPGGTSGFAGPVSSVPFGVGFGNGFGWGAGAPIGWSQVPGSGGMMVGGPGGQIALPGGSTGLGGFWSSANRAGTIGAGLTMMGLPMALSGLSGPVSKGKTLQTILGMGMSGVGLGLLLGKGAFGGVVGAEIGAGAGVFADAMRRGGVTGIFEGMGGGALTGMGIGTMIAPGIGTAIGAGVGAIVGGIAGLFRWAFGDDPPDVKMRKKIKAAYGIDVQDRDFLNSLVQMAQQKYGGNFDLCIRSTEVRDMLETYARMTGQQFPLNLARPRPVSLIESGAQVYQSPVFENGLSYSFAGNLPTIGGSPLDTIPLGSAARAIPITVVVDPQQTQNLWATGTAQGIAQNPRLVASSVEKAKSTNSNRRTDAALTLAPGVVFG